MSKDGPKSGRVGFGFNQAKEAGAPYKGEKTIAKINLENFVKKFPHVRKRVKEELKAGKRANTILNKLREEGLGERYSVEYFGDEKCTVSQEWAYLNDLEALKTDAEQKVRTGYYKGAQVFEFDYQKSDWIVLQQWPEASTSTQLR